MEGSCNEQGGDSLGNDWRTQHEPYLRRKVIFLIVKKLKTRFHQLSENDIKNMTFRFEDRIYGTATDKDDYLRRISRKVLALNQGQTHSTSLPYTHTPTSQQLLPQSNLNSPESSSGLPPTQVPITTVSAAQNLNIQMSEEGAHSNLHPHHASLTIIEQSSPQSSALSSLPPSSGQPNSQMAVTSHEQKQPEQENLISHLTSPQNKGEEQEQTPRPSLLGTQGQEVEQTQPSGGDDDWREETYQKIKALKEKYAHVLSTLLQTFSDKLREIYSLRRQKKPHDPVEWVKESKETLEQLLEFLNVSKSSVSEFHRDKFSRYEAKVLSSNEFYQTKMQRSMQKQQVYQQPQTNQLQIAESEWKDVKIIRKRVNSSKDEFEFQQQLSNDNQIQTESQEHPPLVTIPPEPVSERPIDRLIKAIQSSSPESLAQSVSEMRSVISMSDRFDGSVHSIGGPRARSGEDLSERTRLRTQQGHTNPTKRFKRSVTAIPLDSTASSASKVNKIEPSYALLQEIIEINGKLVETVVSICNEDVCPTEVTSGTVVVTCSYVPVALSATFKALYNSGHISQIQPLRLLVPESYPFSPIILEKDLLENASVHKYEDLTARARSRFGLSMKEYSEPISVKEIAQVWDECARATMVEYAERHGGGTFSSKYGRWESVLRAS